MWSNIQHNRISRENTKKELPNKFFLISKTEEHQSLHLKDPMSTKHGLKKKKWISKHIRSEILEFQNIKKAYKILEENVINKGLVIEMALKQQ